MKRRYDGRQYMKCREYEVNSVFFEQAQYKGEVKSSKVFTRRAAAELSSRRFGEQCAEAMTVNGKLLQARLEEKRA